MRLHDLFGRFGFLLALAGALAATALLAPTASAAATDGALAAGAGTITLGSGFPPQFQGDRVLVALSAAAEDGSAAQGTFRIVHSKPDGSLFADLRGRLDCLHIEGGDAVVTGRITEADTPGIPGGGLQGMAAIIGVSDDHVVFNFGPPDSPSCTQVPAPAVWPLDEGRFVIRQW
jgi:hypothetical protein